MKVSNLNGTSGNTCGCGGWLAHWESISGKKAGLCVVTTCYESATDGGHVQKDSVYDRAWYIVPLCRKCNGKKGESLTITDTTVLVSANVSETCGKKKTAGYGR